MQTNPYSVSYIAEAPDSDPIVIHGDTPVSELKEMLKGADSDTTIRMIFQRAVVWEQRRYEIATSAMQGLLSCGSKKGKEAVARLSVEYADALINELKKQ